MQQASLHPKEKKVEYVELIYDLIFVYVIGRNNQLLHSFENGFVALPAFLAYVMTTLAVIQIWNYTTYYVNVYGRHSVRDHVFLFINMFLMYFIGEGTRADWHAFHTQYHLAWALILVNIGVQYLLERRNRRESAGECRHMGRMASILFGEAVLVAADIPVYKATGSTWMPFAAILFGMGMVFFFGQRKSADAVDFPHLSERAMLYVVFTFGEMIIAISSYFVGDLSLRGVCFALMAFLIVVGLFLSYGVFYDHIIDREKRTNGLSYMLIHILIVFALDNITNGMEFMREEEIRLLPKMLFLIGSFLLFYVCLFMIGIGHARARCGRYGTLCLQACVIGAVFVLSMLLLCSYMLLNISVTAALIFAVFMLIYRYGMQIEAAEFPEKGSGK